MRVVAVCHDAGGAEVVAAWLARRRDDEVVAVLDGPAERVFARVLPGAARAAPFPSLDGVDLVLCGSSGAADLERRAVARAAAAGVRCAVFVDHWTNYAARFGALPDEIWAGDEHAERIARAELPGAVVRRVANAYLEDAVAAVRAAERAAPDPARVLYVSEPTSAAAAAATGDPRGWGYDEREALARYLAALAPPPPAVLRLRPHPAEPPGKYDAVLAAAGRPVERSMPGTPLAHDLAWAGTVVGCDTMALVVALLAGRRAESVIPPGGRPLTLPFPDIARR